MNRYVLGICGGSGSGKTHTVARIVKRFDRSRIAVLSQDAYYKDLSHLPDHERSRVNFDHPDAIDLDLLADDLERLVLGNAVTAPRYDFHTHTRQGLGETIHPAPVILIEGHHIYHLERMRSRIDHKVYLDIDMDLRFIRRLLRDMNERGRDLGSVVQQYLKSVRPMDLEFIQPARRHADTIMTDGDYEAKFADLLLELERFVVWDRDTHA